MIYCKKCITPTTRPGLTLDEEGVCPGCRYFEELRNINWEERDKELQEIVEWAKKNPSPYGYDAVISVSGGKDSTRQALYARDVLGLNPLLASTVFPPEMVTDIGVANLENLTNLGFDTISISPDPIIYKKLMKKGFFEYGNWAKSTEIILYTATQKLAEAYEIPLVVLGENGSIVYGDAASVNDGGNAKNLRNLNTIGGGTLDHLLDNEEGIESKNLLLYNFPNIGEDKMKVIYIGYYIKDFSQIVNGLFAMTFGLKHRNDTELKDIGFLYNFSQSDTDFTQVNQLIKYNKFGFGKATEDISELIKLGIMTRETGIILAKELDGKSGDRFIKSFCEYLDISLDDFNKVAEKYRNKDIWKKVNGKWQLQSPLFNEELK